MAGNSDKKLAKAAQERSKYVFGAMAFFMALQTVSAQNFSSWTYSDYFLQIVMYVICYGSSRWMFNSIRGGYPIDYPLDLFGVNCIIQIGTTFHSAKWAYLYILIPGFVFYKVAGLVAKYCYSNFSSTEDQNSSTKSKRQMKKEKLQEKFGHM
eukprot:GDKJ01011242.1.p1 GENE.GDKJ01011242.1~~GDKJ01011242.1.p1  ORF type:complete len:153 (+),score=15.21 GDKJ01011242.1:19-477(+)